jgi:hypothetical protein
VVDVALHYGLYPKQEEYPGFSFSDVYDPVTFGSARFSEARVWSIFSQIADSDGSFQIEFQDYVTGRNLKKRMPLFVEPYKKLSVSDVMDLMNSHYEGTELDATVDVGGGIFGDVHRPRPLVWEYQEKKYFNERTIATQQTGWNFVAQIRSNMPHELAALIWFAVDDSSTSPRVPVYASSTMVAPPYAGKGTQDGVPGPMLKLDMKKAFWGKFLSFVRSFVPANQSPVCLSNNCILSIASMIVIKSSKHGVQLRLLEMGRCVSHRSGQNRCYPLKVPNTSGRDGQNRTGCLPRDFCNRGGPARHEFQCSCGRNIARGVARILR